MPHTKPPSLLSLLPTFDQGSGELMAVIETPKGSSNKYDYDDTCGAFRLALDSGLVEVTSTGEVLVTWRPVVVSEFASGRPVRSGSGGAPQGQ